MWAHLDAGPGLGGVGALLTRLAAAHPDLGIRVAGALPHRLPRRALTGPALIDTPGLARRTLDHWAPHVLLWAGPSAAPVLWAEALRRGIPCIAVHADPARHQLALVEPLSRFELVLARAPDPRLPRARIVAPATLALMSDPPPANAREHDALREAVGARPLWYAAGPDPDEVRDVLAAHRQALRHSHRLLLVLDPGPPEDRVTRRDTLEAAGWRVAARSAEGEPLPETQIFLADQEDEAGLWVRLAPITFLGAACFAPLADCPPQVPAALGSAIVHMVAAGDDTALWHALTAAGATRACADAEDLGAALIALMSPEAAARMAQDGWSAITAGAEVTDRVMKTVAAALTPPGAA